MVTIPLTYFLFDKTNWRLHFHFLRFSYPVRRYDEYAASATYQRLNELMKSKENILNVESNAFVGYSEGWSVASLEN